MPSQLQSSATARAMTSSPVWFLQTRTRLRPCWILSRRWGGTMYQHWPLRETMGRVAWRPSSRSPESLVLSKEEQCRTFTAHQYRSKFLLLQLGSLVGLLFFVFFLSMFHPLPLLNFAHLYPLNWFFRHLVPFLVFKQDIDLTNSPRSSLRGQHTQHTFPLLVGLVMLP